MSCLVVLFFNRNFIKRKNVVTGASFWQPKQTRWCDCSKMSFSQAIVRRGPFNCKIYLEFKKVKVNFNRTE